MTETCDFLFEIGVEELPPKSIKDLEKALVINVAKGLKSAGLSHKQIISYATPRRLALLIKELIEVQPDQIVEQRGPNLDTAFSADGEPTAACLGFAKACGVSVDKLEQLKNANGAWVVCKTINAGVTSKQLLPKIISQALNQLPIPKHMRWGEGKISFVMPVHWLVMLYGEEIIDCEILGVKASNQTYGHRFHSIGPKVIPLPEKYEGILHKHFVIADFDKRKQKIREQIIKAAIDVGIPIVDEDLLDEVTGLTEWPIAILGKFAEHFLHLPQELLMLCMQKQQRCFPLKNDENQALVANFIAISNIESKNPDHIIKGYEQVIAARLADAEFFYNLDSRFQLDSYFDHLKAAVFQDGLGSLYDKSIRLANLSFNIAQQFDANCYYAKRAAELAKTDLMTAMVGEFPELQGVAGFHYALMQDEPNPVAIAIKEQYLPRFAGDILPETDIGCALAIADRIDTLIGIFCLNKLPTGEKDPFALRRAALGILRILLEKKLDLDIKEFLQLALKLYRDQQEKVSFEDLVIKNYEIPSEEVEIDIDTLLQEIITNAVNFILERMHMLYVEQGINSNVFAAARNAKDQQGNCPSRPLDLDKRITALLHFKSLPEAEALSIAHKRVNNILNKAKPVKHHKFNEELVHAKEELELFKQLTVKSAKIYELGNKALYQEALIELATLKPYIDNFFDKVMVMVDEIKLRDNRLLLLEALRDLLTYVADISKLQI